MHIWIISVTKTTRLLAFLNRNLPMAMHNQRLREYSYKQLLYCASIWDPHYHNAIHQIEN